MKPSEIVKLVRAAVTKRQPIMIEGAVGIGKSSVIEQVAQDLGADLITSYVVTCDPTDASGVLWPDVKKGRALTLPKEDLARALDAKKLTIWFLDDFGQGMTAVQNSFSHLIHARKAGERSLPECVIFIIACNRRTDRAGSQPIVATVQSRCYTAVTMIPDVDEWLAWALPKGIHPAVVTHLRNRPNSLYTETPKLGESFPCPRSWEHASAILEHEFEPLMEREALLGAIGEGDATELAASSMLLREKVDCQAALNDPSYAYSKRPDLLVALASGVAYYALGKEREMFRFAERLYSDGHAEFATMCVSDAVKRVKNITHTPAWLAFTKTPLAKALITF